MPHRIVLTARVVGSLPSPLQDPAAAADGHGALLLGGLTAADTSTSDIVSVTPGGHGVRLGALPVAVHDAAAVTLGGATYLFGGGNGVSQSADIYRIDPRTGRSVRAGSLPAPSSDQTATALGGTAYVVGGYTGATWLDTIVAWRPGSSARVVGHLPAALRYAAVTAAAGRIVIAGGSLIDGTASSDVLAFAPGTGRIRRIGRLPAPTTHAAAATLGGVAYVIGGRGPTPGTAVSRIVAVDPAAGKIRVAGRLPSALSDVGAATAGGRILVAGGRGAAGTAATVTALDQRSVLARAQPRALASARNVYAADAAGKLSAVVAHDPYRIYVPNSQSNTVDVIDPHTFRVVSHFAVGALPQHVTPAWDLRTLYVLNDQGNSLTPIDPRTSKPKAPIPVDDPYNMYFTPNGRYAIVVAERLHRLDFRDAHTFALHRSLTVPCGGVDHMDFTADGRYALASCEFSSQMLVVDVARERIARTIALASGRGMPQDVKLSPDGKVFYVADMMSNGLWEIGARSFRVTGFLATGRGVHGLYPSRDARYLYATNRGEGSISVISFRTRHVVTTWRIPGGGSPDMGGVSPDGRVLWVSGRYNGVVYAIDTRTGRLRAKIPVGSGPHGLSVWPQPGRYSLGHTGILR